MCTSCYNSKFDNDFTNVFSLFVLIVVNARKRLFICTSVNKMATFYLQNKKIVRGRFCGRKQVSGRFLSHAWETLH